MLETTCRPLSGKPSALTCGLRASFRNACLAVTAIALPALHVEGQKISEVVADHVGTDTYEYVEIYASPSANLSAYRIVVLDGSANPGAILNVFSPGTANGAGFWWTGSLTSTLESPTFTVLLVTGFSGSVGQDLDGGNDGVLDLTPWTGPSARGPTRLLSSGRDSAALRASRTTSIPTR
jgi:hypothetical protein